MSYSASFKKKGREKATILKIKNFLHNFSSAGKKRLASEVHWITAMLSVIPNGKPYHRFLEKGEAIALKMTVAN